MRTESQSELPGLESTSSDIKSDSLDQNQDISTSETPFPKPEKKIIKIKAVKTKKGWVRSYDNVNQKYRFNWEDTPIKHPVDPLIPPEDPPTIMDPHNPETPEEEEARKARIIEQNRKNYPYNMEKE